MYRKWGACGGCQQKVDNHHNLIAGHAARPGTQCKSNEGATKPVHRVTLPLSGSVLRAYLAIPSRRVTTKPVVSPESNWGNEAVRGAAAGARMQVGTCTPSGSSPLNHLSKSHDRSRGDLLS